VDRSEIRITGFGGQGVVLSGYIIGKACSIFGGRQATLIQSFGPEARGSACSATLVVEDGEVLYPYVRKPKFMVALSSEGYEKFRDELVADGMLIHEQDLVHPTPGPGQQAYSIPSTRIAEELGRSIVQNIVMLGFFTAVTRLVSREAMRDAVKSSVPGGTVELNLKAYEAGLDYYDKHYGSQAESENAAVSTAGIDGGR